MKKVSIILLFTFIFMWGCTNQNKINELEDVISDQEDIIESCNNQIEDAQSYAWWTYEEMEDALYNLRECEY